MEENNRDVDILIPRTSNNIIYGVISVPVAPSLKDLKDVCICDAKDGDILSYDEMNSRWVNAPVSAQEDDAFDKLVEKNFGVKDGVFYVNDSDMPDDEETIYIKL